MKYCGMKNSKYCREECLQTDPSRNNIFNSDGRSTSPEPLTIIYKIDTFDKSQARTGVFGFLDITLEKCFNICNS